MAPNLQISPLADLVPYLTFADLPWQSWQRGLGLRGSGHRTLINPGPSWSGRDIS